MKNKFFVKMLALTLSAVVVAGCGAFAGCNNNSDGGNKVPETQKIEDLFDDRYVNLYGRNYYNENYEGTTFINSASGFELKFCGTAVYANICVIGSRSSMWSVFVDGETDSNARVLTFKETRGLFVKNTLVEGLSDGEHVVKVLKRTPSNFDRIIVSDLSCDGAFIAAPEKPALNIEFYGDSITCGEGVLREYQPSDSRVYTAETQNALQAYTAYCASELGASFSVFGRGGSTATGTGAAASGFASGFASRFKGNSYVRDAVVDGGTRMGMGGGVGFVGRVFGGVAARNGAMLTGESISSVAARPAEAAGTIAGDIADRSLGNYMPQLAGHTLKGTQISGGHISTTATGTDGKVSSVEMFNTAQFEKPAAPHSVVTATDGSTWYQMASGEGRNAFYDAPGFTGSPAESEQVAAAFPGAAEGTVLRNTGDGIMEAGSESGNSLWYNSAYYNEPDAPHTVMQAANGVDWYAMQQHAEAPAFEQGEAADAYNQAAFRNFMPGFEQQVAHVDGTHREDGHFEVRHTDGSGTAFYDTARFAAPRGDYQVYEDVRGQQWIAIHGDPTVERKPVFEDGKPVYDGENVRTVSVESVRYKNMPSRFKEPEKRPDSGIKAPKRRK